MIPKDMTLVREGEWARPHKLSGRVAIIHSSYDVGELIQGKAPAHDKSIYYVVIDPERHADELIELLGANSFASERAAMQWAADQIEGRIYWHKDARNTLRRRAAFVSYMREDDAVIEGLVADLRHHGMDVWLDRDSIDAGELWRDAIRTAIAQGTAFLGCFSRHFRAGADTYMNEELAVAIDEAASRRDKSWLVPVMLDDTALPSLSIGANVKMADFQWVDYRHRVDGARALRRKLGGNGVMFGGGPFEDRVARAAQLWNEDGRTTGYLLTGEAFVAAQCWTYERDVDETARAFVEASRRALGGNQGWDHLLRRRVPCPGCRLEYRVENLSICTDCFVYYCPTCRDDAAHRSSCRGEMVG